MDKMRVLIVNCHSLLMDGVESLLEANGQYEVVSTSASKLPDLIGEIKHLKPNIVIIDEAMTYIKPAHLITSLPNIQKVRLIVMNSRTSRMDIYDKSKLYASTPDHFLEAINNKMTQYLLK